MRGVLSVKMENQLPSNVGTRQSKLVSRNYTALFYFVDQGLATDMYAPWLRVSAFGTLVSPNALHSLSALFP